MKYDLQLVKAGNPRHIYGHRQIRCANCDWITEPFHYHDREREVAGYFAGREHKCPARKLT